ncbi:MAG: SpoIID/LytB domain-containing protein [Prevotellaceae bacterium]|jgi:SpoIID/LytB domain protein|nr:SpoIID/LytB domain-containing protein [Prevotellaceae bacterium]
MSQKTEPTISVGIVSGSEIRFVFNENYLLKNEIFVGEKLVSLKNGKICFQEKLYDELIFCPENKKTASFNLPEVLIGIGFHWQRSENQRFSGELKIIVEEDKLTAINIVPLEDYLLSVISSEMNATSSLELLKAHAVTSRSWLLAQLAEKKLSTDNSQFSILNSQFEKWYDREDHTHFDVCADDHCQRYQGISKASTDAVRQAIEATRGEVILHEGKVCDARFSKCCGGISELFENCWQPEHHDYLLPVEDRPQGAIRTTAMTESEARQFIKNPPEGDFCNTVDTNVLRQVLNDYDCETPDFYRWQLHYSQAELSALIARRSGIDFGTIFDLIPEERGISGRIIRLKIVGSKRTLIVGKELEIRKWLSESHLYSSAFVVEKEDIQGGIPQKFQLYGAGWGHGVGLCQIGAAVMAEQGYNYKQIVNHYFKNINLEKIY